MLARVTFLVIISFFKGASLKHQDNKDLTAFDHVKNTDDWIECGIFSNEINDLLRGKVLVALNSADCYSNYPIFTTLHNSILESKPSLPDPA